MVPAWLSMQLKMNLMIWMNGARSTIIAFYASQFKKSGLDVQAL